MNLALNNLLQTLQPQSIDKNIFIAKNQDVGLKHVFGGQIMAQALLAAYATVESERYIHSYHCYFTRTGELDEKLTYQIENLRDGLSISTRRITAIQYGQPIFYMLASFQPFEEGLEHQQAMPTVVPPEILLSEEQIVRNIAQHLPPDLQQILTQARAIEIRPTQFQNPFRGEVTPPINNSWFRAAGQLSGNLSIHQSLLSYSSDFTLLPTSLHPHGIGFLENRIQLATIDHSMWFHRPFNFENWLLYHVESTSASNGRGFSRGQFFNQNGQLIASSAQEGIIRFKANDK